MNVHVQTTPHLSQKELRKCSSANSTLQFTIQLHMHSEDERDIDSVGHTNWQMEYRALCFYRYVLYPLHPLYNVLI